jgi:hypothetical protein
MHMSREVEEVLAVWRELERVRESLPVGSTERTSVNREILEVKRLYRSLTRRVSVSLGRPDTIRPILERAYDALHRAKLGLDTTGTETVRPEPLP